ncbi:adenine deaminase [Thermaerobacillus caldiproteolyticus]|uniref:Adenine deaminase n=1 Tax=Thermaerobacillus caldiproteolyticus TaxID=247480 RepID=A0A7V9Z691_9BACL|nr:adenine deaminase [Anoxybacillus caldiproteolyticus]MBA2874832.1 adenine deaminase [Anoxybacillus caldiproteolyticus]
MKKHSLIKRIAVASKKEQADIVVKNGKIVNVFTHEIIEEDIAIVDGVIAGIGKYEGKITIDANGKYICPGLIDGHVHIESAMVRPSEFAKVVVPHGVTTVITDPHEIANVAGIDGIQFMLDDSEHVPLDVYVMIPSCVPSTPFEHAGAALTAKDLEPLFSHPRVIGLAEVMDYPALLQGDSHIIDKLVTTFRYTNRVDGHAAGLNVDAINVYTSAQIKTDHECVNAEEALDRVRRGMYVLLRQGTVAKDLERLIPAVNPQTSRRFLFCTDDKHVDDLLSEGSIDYNVRLAIQNGIDPVTAIQMATINAAQCYQLHTKGAIAPGYDADFLLLDDLETMNITHVYKAGVLVAENGAYVLNQQNKVTKIDEKLFHSMNAPKITADDIQIHFTKGRTAHVIQVIPNNLHTKHIIENVDVENGVFVPSIEKDVLKLIVVERHKRLGHIGVGIVKGFGIKCGAIASSVAHDSHNIIAVGTNDADLAAAANYLNEIGGGLVIVKNGIVLASLPLEIGGLMSSSGYQTVYKQLKELNKALSDIGASQQFNPFVTLAFLALPVIPELKITDKGLFDVKVFQHISVEAAEK